jgi:hypothetical protein
MSFFDTFCEMLVILFAIALGYLADKLHYLDQAVDQKISKLLLNVIMPALIVSSVITGDNLPDASQVLDILKVAMVFYGTEALFVLIVPRLLGGTPGQQGVWRFGLAFPNMAFIGYPVVVAMFGQEALFYAVILVLPFNLISYTLGPLMLSGAGKFRWQQLVSPCVVSAVIALVLALTGLRPPALIGEMLSFVGDVTVPLSLLMVGSLLASLPARQVLAVPRLWGFAVIRLLVMPVVLCLLLRLLGTDTMTLNVSVVQMAMPMAINGNILSMEYGGDTECMAQATFLTTLASIVTIPMMSSLLL